MTCLYAGTKGGMADDEQTSMERREDVATNGDGEVTMRYMKNN